jgi:hypothetical protein
VAGSIRQRDDRGLDVWELRVFLGRDCTGRVRHRNATFRASSRAAERELARLVAAQEREPERALLAEEISSGPQTTIDDAVEGWRRNGWQDLSPCTVRGYVGVWRRHVRDSIGRRRIASLSRYDVERCFRELKAKGAGPTTVRLTGALLHRSCRLARTWSGNQLPTRSATPSCPSGSRRSARHRCAPRPSPRWSLFSRRRALLTCV